jgi:hypothetical protein
MTLLGGASAPKPVDEMGEKAAAYAVAELGSKANAGHLALERVVSYKTQVS